ncbi:Postreplication repair E3 ubiquitin-protein ligase RAD18 [Candida tropicalis]
MDINELDNITDPSDFKLTKLPNLSELDLLKRCFICKDFFRAPVTISTCHHIYCSQCIREHLLRKPNCPICKCEIFESNLRPDPLLEDIVNDKEDEKLTEISDINEEGRVKEEINGNISNGDAGKDGKVGSETPVMDNSIEVIEILSDDGQIVTNNTKIGTCPICQERMPIEILERRHVDDCLNGRKPKRNAAQILQQQPRKKQSKGITSITAFFKQSTSPDTTSSPETTTITPPPGTPQDNHKPVKSIQSGQYEDKETPVINIPARIPKLDFHSLTTPKVKAKLKELQLSTTGDRNELMRRYNQYFVFVNANIDSNHPVDESTLRDRLSKWERSFKSKAKDSLDTDANWKSLVAKARQSK